MTQWTYYKFSSGSESGTGTVTITGTNFDRAARMYAFRNVATSSFTEGASFGIGDDDVILARSVTTLGDKRLGVSFVSVENDISVGNFIGEGGGYDWTEAVNEFTFNGDDDICMQLQTATMTSAGTISGGSYDTGSTNYRWGVRAFALKPKTIPQPWVITEGSGQNNRWTEETNQYKGRGSDKLNVAAGTVTMSWSTDYAPNWVCSAVVINPVPLNYELNLEEQFTGVDYDEQNEWLCIYTGTLSPDERLQVYVSTEPVPLMTLSAANATSGTTFQSHRTYQAQHLR